jgi:hypothetical protein
MAKQENGYLRGALGPVIYFRWGNRYFVKSRPVPTNNRKQKNNAAVKAFTNAATYGYAMLDYLSKEILPNSGLSFRNNFRGWLTKAQLRGADATQQSLSSTCGVRYDLNAAASLTEHVPALPTITHADERGVLLSFPEAAALTYMPAYTKSILVKLMVTTHPFKGIQKHCGWGMESFTVKPGEALPEGYMELPLKHAKQGDLLLLTMAVQYKTSSSEASLIHPWVQQAKWQPVGVIAMGRVGE